jgi:hypothetical protein
MNCGSLYRAVHIFRRLALQLRKRRYPTTLAWLPVPGCGGGSRIFQGGRSWRGLSYLTGPGYDVSAFASAPVSGSDVDERRCGRVYVQGVYVS